MQTDYELQERLNDLTRCFTELREKLDAVAQALPDPIFIINDQGCYVDVIGGGARSLYHTPHFLKGQFLHEVLPLELAERFLEIIHEAIEDKSLKTVEYEMGVDDVRGTQPDGPPGKQWYEGRIYPIPVKQNEVPSVVWIAINITRRKRLQRKLKEFAETDPLTHIYNRRYFLKSFRGEFSIAKKQGTPLSIMMIDIDLFKKINDHNGHDSGDLAIKNCVSVCTSKLRTTDLLARFGGDEFILLLPDTTVDGASIMAERIREGVNDVRLFHNGKTIQYSVSIGVSSVHPDDRSIYDVLYRADVALLDAKKRGRDRVVAKA